MVWVPKKIKEMDSLSLIAGYGPLKWGKHSFDKGLKYCLLSYRMNVINDFSA